MTFKTFVNLFEALDQDLHNRINEAITSIGPDVELYIVGGAVRDKLLGIDSKDIDFVVTKLPYNKGSGFDGDGYDALDAIKDALDPMVRQSGGSVSRVGESFGIVTATIEGEDFDFAIPRMKETKTGEGHADFEVELDPSASITDDLSRRDFTFNAIAQSMDGSLVDPFGGAQDIKNGLIRAVGNPEARFKEDPLRMLRAFQFASRLSTSDGKPFTIEENTLNAISKLGGLIKKSISGERILAEFEKAWTKGRSNVETLIKMLDTTGVGKDLFGSSFSPLSISIQGDKDEQAVAKFVGMFINGGEEEFIKLHEHLPSVYIEYLKLTRNIIKGDKDPWEFIGSHKGKLPLLLKIVDGLKKEFGSEPVKYVRKMMQVPIIPKDLALNGADFMDFGLKGKEIGLKQREILSAIWSGDLNNTKKDLTTFISNKDDEIERED